MEPPYQEKELIDCCLSGNRRAQRMLYERYAGIMMAVCYRYAGQKENAEDWMQEGFIKVFAMLHTFQRQGSFEGWIRRIMVNTVLENLRKNDALKQSIDILESPLISEEVSQNALEKMAVEDLLRLIAELPPGFRTVFNLFAIEGFSHQEIAEQLNISEGTSRSQYSRAKKILQKKIEELEYNGNK